MQFTDILSFCFSILGLYGLVYYLRFLIPRGVLPHVSAVLAKAEHLLDCAESTGVNGRMTIDQPYIVRSRHSFANVWSRLAVSYSNQFLRIRMESHRTPRILQQL